MGEESMKVVHSFLHKSYNPQTRYKGKLGTQIQIIYSHLLKVTFTK
jgi:hypothetical protein